VAEFAVVDTSILAFLTKWGRYSDTYSDLLAPYNLAISFQTRAELLAAGYSPPRQRRLDDLLSRSVILPHSDDTSEWYARAIIARRRLRSARRLGSDASDGDVWVMSSSGEYETPLISHDRHQVSLARAIDIPTFTALPALHAGNPA
jgi:predicted nucleic acid-binding protein